MPSDPPRPPSRAWRKDADAVARPTKTPDAKAWQDSAAKARFPRPLLVSLVAGLMLALLGAFVYVVLFPKPHKPPYLLVAGSDNRTRLAVPAGVVGSRDQAALQQWAEDEKNPLQVRRFELFKNRDDWDQWFA